MFNTELFVVEVQKRPCLWNTKDSSHGDREQRIQAWNQIAKVLNTSSDSYSLKNKNITIDELQRKWKHLRDYYTREKKRTSRAEECSTDNNSDDVKGDTSVRKKRKSPLLDMLQFLHVNRGNDIVEVTIERNAEEDIFFPENNEDDDKSLSEYELLSPRPSKIQKSELHQTRLNEETDLEDSTEKQFLTSLLPIIRNMSARERANFRSQLLNPTRKERSVEFDEKTSNSETRKQNKTIHIKEEIEHVNRKRKKDCEATFNRDEFSIFGKYIANKLRNIQNKQARHTAEFHINRILYKAEMGEYDTVSRDVTNATKSVTCTDYNNTRSIDSPVHQEDDSNDSSIIKAEVLD